MNPLRGIRRGGAALFAFAAIALAGCGGDSTGTDDDAISITLGATTLTITQGANATLVVNVTRGEDADGALTVSAEGLPSGVTASNVTIADGSNQGTLTFNATSAATLGAKTVTIRVDGDEVDAKTATVALTVAAPAAPFTVSTTASSVTLSAGGTATATFTAARTGTFTGDVALTATAPAGLTATFSAPALTAAVTSSVLTITAGAGLAAGTYTVVVHAVNGTTDQTTNINVTVAGAGGGFSLSLASPTVSIAAGAQGSATVNITRVGGFAGTVNLTATTPAGVTASFSPAGVSANSSAMTLTVGAGVAAGPLTVTVRGNATGMTEQTATLNLTVTAVGGGAGNVTFSFCGGGQSVGVPVFVAAQDASGAWTGVTAGANGSYSFQINGARGGVAWVTPVTGGGFQTNIFYGTTAELQSFGTVICGGSPGTKTVTATIAGAGVADQTTVSLGQSSMIVTGNGTATLANVSSGSLDLIAARSSTSLAPPFATTPVSVNVQRGLNIAANGSAGTITVSGGAAPASATITVNGLGADIWTHTSTVTTANNSAATLFTDVSGSAAATKTWYGLPASAQIAGDLHTITIVAFPLATQVLTRAAQIITASVTAKTVTLGPVMTAPTVTVLGTAPYVRLNATYTIQTEYNKAWTVNSQQGTGAATRIVSIMTTAGYNGAGATIASAIPDLTASGYLADYGLKTGALTTTTFSAQGWTGTSVFGQFVDGTVVLTGSSISSITP